MKPCLVKGCMCLAKWNPSVLVTIDNHKSRLDFQIPVCDNHKATLKLGDIVPDETLKVIQNMYKSNFIHPPTLNNMTLEWMPDIPNTIKVYTDTGKEIGAVGVKHRN